MIISEYLVFFRYFLGFALVLQSIENLILHTYKAHFDISKWDILKLEFKDSCAFKILDFIFRDKPFTILLIFKLLFSTSLFFILNPHLLVFLYFFNIIILLRWGGEFNGGSDYMTSSLLIGLFFISIGENLFLKIGVYYIAVHVSASYFISGIYKITKENWRNGKVLNFLVSDKIDLSKKNSLIFSYFVMFMEILFPLVFLSKRLAIFYLSFMFVFHLINWWLFGLNRFVWVWGAAYPIIYSLSG